MGSSAPDPPRGDETDRTDPPGATADLVTEAVADLYGADPQEFTDRRKALAAAAKAAGDAAAAKQIAALRKPTRAAWVVNRLVRTDPDAPTRLASLAAALRAAEQAKDGPRLRELSADRGRLIDTLTSQALTAADVADPPAGLREEVTATLTAALADPEVAAAFTAGTLTRAAEWAGFGLAFSAAPDTDDASTAAQARDSGEATATAEPPPDEPSSHESPRATADLASAQVVPLPPAVPRRHLRALTPGTPADGPVPLQEGEVKDGRPLQEGGLKGRRPLREAPPLQEGRRLPAAERERERKERAAQEKAQRLAEEAAEAAGRRRKIFDDAERAVASAAATAAAAVAAEDRLEDEVRDLEERLTRARADLADTRLRARRAETAERKARQLLDRLPPPEGASSP